MYKSVRFTNRHLSRAHWRRLQRKTATLLLIAATAIFSIVAEYTAIHAAEPRAPNVVILLADDMGYGDLAVQNPASKIPTPNLDRLAGEGLRFTDAHSSSGICTPSRYALLTGRYHWRKFHGIVNSFDPPVFDDGELTLAEMLRRKGYRTACVGKWHLGWNWNAIKRDGAKSDGKLGYAADAFDWTQRVSGGPLDHGFEYYFGDDVPNFPPYAWIENDHVITAPTERLTVSPAPAEGNAECRPGPMAADWRLDAVMPKLTEKAVAWIGQQKGRESPFFLYFPFTSPHAPIVPTKAFRDKSQAGGYGDYVVQTDDTVGQVLRALKENGFGDNTIVLFTSDNGPEHYAYPRVKNFSHRSMGPLRGLKRDIWEGGHRVPFIVRWPGIVKAGGVSDALVGQIDIVATLAAVTGFEIPHGAAQDSRNQLPLLRDENAKSAREELVHNTYKDHYAMRQGHWLYIDAPSGEVTKSPAWFNEANGYTPNEHRTALFDLQDDLGQRRNVVAENPQVVERLRERLQQIRAGQ
ncbi:MAG: arylsulfatase [Pirellulales bacterium]